METERQTPRPAPVPRLLEAIRERMPNPVRLGLYLVLASTPLLASTLGAQPSIVPVKVANKKSADPVLPLADTLNPVPPLYA